MAGEPDLRAMSRDELVAYFDAGGDVSDLLRDAVPGPDPGPAPSTLPTIDDPHPDRPV